MPFLENPGTPPPFLDSYGSPVNHDTQPPAVQTFSSTFSHTHSNGEVLPLYPRLPTNPSGESVNEEGTISNMLYGTSFHDEDTEQSNRRGPQ